MPRGLPDYGQNAEQYAIAGMGDLGEAVARLNSINVYDRRGFTVWQDDFEAPALKWTATATGSGIVPYLSTDQAFSGVQSVYFDAAFGGAPICHLSRRFPLIRRGKIGLEYWVQGNMDSPSYFELVFTVYDGAIPNSLSLRYDTSTPSLRVLTTVGWQTLLPAPYMWAEDNYFLPIKVVFDMDTDRWVRVLWGEQEFDLSQYFVLALPANADRYVDAHFRLVGSGAVSQWARLDNFILTQNEP